VPFEWDEAKNQQNRAKHRVSFETAILAFEDSYAISWIELFEGEEERWRTLGSAGGVAILLVAHTYSDQADKSGYGSFLRERPHEGKGRFMKKASKRQAKELKALAEMPDSKIDLTDIPEVRNWSGAVVGKFYRPIKKPVTIRVDADVLAWLKRQGRGYQTRINALLRESMNRKAKRLG
jgi:uncharacterized protein (DUF4415 family)/uncharacterized DUF497 family protein